VGTNLNGVGELLQELTMNLVEFIFAVTAVFGSTGIIIAWTSLAYRIEQANEKNKQDTIRTVK
jgi:hypothetical protein